MELADWYRHMGLAVATEVDFQISFGVAYEDFRNHLPEATGVVVGLDFRSVFAAATDGCPASDCCTRSLAIVVGVTGVVLGYRTFYDGAETGWHTHQMGPVGTPVGSDCSYYRASFCDVSDSRSSGHCCGSPDDLDVWGCRIEASASGCSDAVATVGDCSDLVGCDAWVDQDYRSRAWGSACVAAAHDVP